MINRPPRLHQTAHSSDCWTVHEECAISSAISYLSARIAHDQARLGLYRRSSDPRTDAELRKEAIAMARALMHENATRDWGRVG